MCQGRTKKGKPCKRTAQEPYCYQHTPAVVEDKYQRRLQRLLDRGPKKNDKPGFIYVYHLAGEENMYKIGKTKRAVEKRIREQNNGRVVVLDLKLQTRCCDFAEKYLHTRLARQRVYRYETDDGSLCSLLASTREFLSEADRSLAERYKLQGRKKQIEWFRCNLATIQTMSKEAVAYYTCPDLERAFKSITHGIKHPECYSEIFPQRKRLLVASQPSIDKHAMLAPLLQDIPLYVLDIPETASDTCALIHRTEIDPTETPVLVIRNAHRLLYQYQECPDVRFFALNLRFKDLIVIALSDVPYIDHKLFYAQFELKVALSLPTMEYLKELYRAYFSRIPDHTLTDEDYDWLVRCSDWCTPLDVYEFCAKVFYRCCCETRTPVTRELLESPHNKFISDQQHPGIWSISAEDVRMRQVPFDVCAERGFVPKKRPREDE